MANIDSLKKKLNDPEFVDKILSEETKDICKVLTFKINGRPESYARERKGRGKHFYNPKSEKMAKTRKDLIHQLSKEDYAFIKNLIDNPESDYFVELSMKYFIKIPNSTSIKDSIKMIHGIIRPIVRPDIDNYNKYILDTLHEVLYDDDNRVVRSEEEKLYAIEPRTEITAFIYVKNGNKE